MANIDLISIKHVFVTILVFSLTWAEGFSELFWSKISALSVDRGRRCGRCRRKLFTFLSSQETFGKSNLYLAQSIIAWRGF